jgi:hypothetical protein
MATATIIAAWHNGKHAHLSAAIAEGGAMGLVEYIVKTPLLDEKGKAKDTNRLQTELTTALQAARDKQRDTRTPLDLGKTVAI